MFEALKYRIEVNEWGYTPLLQQCRRTAQGDGPAVEHTNGNKVWYHNDRLHRTGGPAVEWANGHIEWWINGVILTEAEFNQAVKQYE